jgi:3-isopropylmalate/(R)-2-methylmalate dehydratase small subunit
MKLVETNPETEIVMDLENMKVSAGNTTYSLAMPESFRKSLTTGTWDTTATLLANRELIEKKAQELKYIAGY